MLSAADLQVSHLGGRTEKKLCVQGQILGFVFVLSLVGE